MDLPTGRRVPDGHNVQVICPQLGDVTTVTHPEPTYLTIREDGMLLVEHEVSSGKVQGVYAPGSWSRALVVPASSAGQDDE